MRKRAMMTYGLWCAVLIGGTAALAWEFGWIPVEITTAETGTLAEASSTTLTSEAATADAGNEATADPIIFVAQSEPALNGQTIAASPPRAGQPRPLPSTNPWDQPEPALAPGREAVAAIRAERTEPAVDAGTGFTPPQRDTRIAPASLQIEDENFRKMEPPQPLPESAQNSHPSSPFEPRPRSQIVQVSGQLDPLAETSAEHDPRLQAIDRLIADGDILSAHKELSRIYWKEPEYRPLIQERIDSTAKTIYFSPQPHFMEPYLVQPGDQLRKVSVQYRVPWQYLAKLNQVDPARIRVGQRLKVIKGPFSALVDLSDFELIVHAHGYYVRRYRVGIGRDGTTPLGKFTVLEKVANPQYTDPDGRVIQGDDPANPLGERWLDLGDSYGIHGTIEPESIGTASSRGCVRMVNADVEEVYDLLDVGSEVIIRR